MDISAKYGITAAQYLLGREYHSRRNYEKAKEYYKLAAEKNHVMSLEALAYMAINESGIDQTNDYNEQKIEEAKQYFEIAAKHNLQAHGALGDLYLKLKKPNEAEYHFTIAAEQGNAIAQNNLANLCQNLEKAKYWYALAAQQGLWQAQWNLIRIYNDENNIEELSHYVYLVTPYIEKLKIAENTYLLATYYQKIQNHEKARYYYAQAANLGYSHAQYMLAFYLTEEGNNEKAMYYLKLAADQGHINAQYLLAILYLKEAKKYFKLAADQGDTKAKENLEKLNRK